MENKLLPDDSKFKKWAEFCLKYGECFGFLGVNGAGKTTTFKCLSNEIFPTSGTIYIDNKEITSNFNKIRNLIGYCPQFNAIFDYLTVFKGSCSHCIYSANIFKECPNGQKSYKSIQI